MTTQTEALTLALKNAEAIVNSNLPQDCPDCEATMVWVHSMAQSIVQSIKEALAQPEQEPVAHTAVFHFPNCEYPHRQVTHITGTAQPPWSPQRKRLTHEQRLDVMEKFAPHQNKWAAISIMIDLVEDVIEANIGPMLKADEAITAIKEALEKPDYEKAYLVWQDKTEWVQETVEPHELGMHRADVLRQRIEALAQPEQEPTNLERHESNVQKFLGTQQPKEPEQDEYLSKAYRLANELRCHLAIAHAPQRTWVGLTDDEAVSAVSSVLPVTSTGGQTHYLQIQHKHALEITRAIEAKLKEKNI